LGIGLLVSFPVIIAGSSIISGVLAKFPCIMWLGALFLGWTSGGIIASETYIAQHLDLYGLNHADIGALFACIVVVTGLVMSKHKSTTTLGNENNSDKT
jgi:predicted tellurium resistance membrane protein TerC